jgi:hypothetical protein
MMRRSNEETGLTHSSLPAQKLLPLNLSILSVALIFLSWVAREDNVLIEAIELDCAEDIEWPIDTGAFFSFSMMQDNE